MLLAQPVTRWSASDLVDSFTCAHRGALERAVRSGERERPEPSGEAAVVARRALELEHAVVQGLRDAGVAITTIAYPYTRDEDAAAAAATLAAFAAGAEAVVNATFNVDGFSGVADLALRVAGHSVFGAWSYEIVDIRLGATSTPAAILQACAYAEALARVSGTDVDDASFGVARGDGSIERFRAADVAAFYRAARERMFAERAAPAPTLPEKIPACARCRWNEACAAARVAADDLSLVANIRRTHVLALREHGITTLAALAAAPPAARPPAIAAGTWAKLHDQASLQDRARDGALALHLLPPDDRSGFALLPEPSPGDVYFDMEGDPFVPGGLEYLFGLGYHQNGEPCFRPVWAHEPHEQLTAVAEVLAFIEARRAADPSMHVYHYAAYERTALIRLTAGTPLEDTVEALFAAEVFVDLYAVVRGALRVSTPSYSIKALELFYRGRKRTSEVSDAMGSVVAYEEYLRTHDAALLEQIRIYNQDDCDSTRELHHWLVARKAEAYATYGPPAPAAAPEPYEPPDDAELDALRATLGGRAAHDVLLADLLEYHRREHRPRWRAYFERVRMEPAELLDDPECLAGLEPAVGIAPEQVDRSTKYVLTFPPQAHALRPGVAADDPATRRSAGEIVEVVTNPDGSGRIALKRGRSFAGAPLPAALVPRDVFSNNEVRDALRRLARRAAAGDPGGAASALLERRLPRRRSGAAIDGREAIAPDRLAGLIDDIDGAVLVVQGPPGTGKTWTAARAVVDLLERGRRVGVASGTHKAINNLLGEIEAVAAERGYPLRGMKKSDRARPETLYRSPGGAILDEDNARAFPPDPAVRLLAGTPALFAREALAGALDVLFVDEAGQMALADAAAIAASANVLVLVGDPQQLPHVTVGAHPAGAGASALEHLLAGEATVAPERGVFLPMSYRLHPAIARFVSELMYDGRLTGAPGCAAQRLIAPDSPLDGAGLRRLPIAHRGRSNASPEEAAAIVAALRELGDAGLVDAGGTRRRFEPARDAIVVAPYNAQVEAVRTALDAAGFEGVRAGTVDKFQGQEAAVVFYSMAASSGEDVPRGVDFLADRNRLNVAISRARTVAVLVHAPALLALRPASVEQMRLLNALARFAELAT